MRVEKIYFESIDGVELFGLLHLGDDIKDDKYTDGGKTAMISVHGMGSNGLKKRDDIIAQKLVENNIAYFSFDNRGSGIVKSFHTNTGKILQGSAFEDVHDCYYDICGAIKFLIEKGYENIHLLGHSLGSTKVIYFYNELLKYSDSNKINTNDIKQEDSEQSIFKKINKKQLSSEILPKIKSVGLLSLVDLVEIINILISNNPKIDIAKIGLEKECENNLNYLIETKESFMPYISCKTFLRLYKYNKNIDFARYTDNTFKFEKLNNIKVPLFMRWGNVNELISIPADQVVKIVDNKIINNIKDIGFIDGANHSYFGKEEILAEDILKFISKI